MSLTFLVTKRRNIKAKPTRLLSNKVVTQSGFLMVEENSGSEYMFPEINSLGSNLITKIYGCKGAVSTYHKDLIAFKYVKREKVYFLFVMPYLKINSNYHFLYCPGLKSKIFRRHHNLFPRLFCHLISSLVAMSAQHPYTICALSNSRICG